MGSLSISLLLLILANVSISQIFAQSLTETTTSTPGGETLPTETSAGYETTAVVTETETVDNFEDDNSTAEPNNETSTTANPEDSTTARAEDNLDEAASTETPGHNETTENSGTSDTTTSSPEDSTVAHAEDNLDEAASTETPAHTETTENSGSSDTTTSSPEDSTVAHAEDNLDEAASTETPAHTETTENSGSSDTTTSSPEDSTAVRAEDNLDEQSNTASTANPEDTTTGSIETTTEPATEPKTTTLPPVPTCSTPGVQAHVSDCQQYYECSLEGSADGNLHLIAKSCPAKQAFNAEFNRCSRDISSCSPAVSCALKGSVADPLSNYSYYICDPRVDGLGFRIFHVQCASYEIYYPLFGRCFTDPTSPNIFHFDLERDFYIVKEEMKQLRKQEKLKLKQEAENKKKLEKEAKKKAKEQEKLNKMKLKLELANFACLEEGNYASQVSDNYFIMCSSKKGKFKAISMKCATGVAFNPVTGMCDNLQSSGNGDDDSSASDEEDDN